MKKMTTPVFGGGGQPQKLRKKTRSEEAKTQRYSLAGIGLGVNQRTCHSEGEARRILKLTGRTKKIVPLSRIQNSKVSSHSELENTKILKNTYSSYTLRMTNNYAQNYKKYSTDILTCSHTNFKKAAFTLSEVLITLGIIGIVAALTMPAIVTKYQKKVTASRIKKVYSELSQAVKLSEVDNGPIKDWDFHMHNDPKENTKLIVEKYIKPYYKNFKECIKEKERCGVNISDNGHNYIIPNGAAFAFVAYPGDKSIYFLLTPNGKLGSVANNEKLGTGTFYFMIDNNSGLKPFGWKDDLTKETIKSGYKFERWNISCNETDRNACTALLMLDGWVFKDDYPW